MINLEKQSETSVVSNSEDDPKHISHKMKNTEFTEEELILLLYVYLRYRDEWFSAQKPYVIDLSNLYRALPIHPDEIRNAENFRNPAGIDMQLRSLAKCDPSDYHRQKLVPSASMRKVWSNYSNDVLSLNNKIDMIISKYEIDTSLYPTLF